MINKFKTQFARNLSNVPGWSTRRKIIVIESDDWGSVRMPSTDTFVKLVNQGVDLESIDYARYNHNDTLANQKDFECLYEVLSGVKDKNGKYCVFTAVSVVANPDFKKIKESNFSEYYYEPFTTTLSRYYPNEDVFSLWREGIDKQLFVPQFHGREHLNVIAWMKALRMHDTNTVLSFNEGMWGFVPESKNGFNVENQAAFQLTDLSDLTEHKKIIVQGLDLFNSLFGYRARYFVPPNGPINNSLNYVLAENGIKFRSTAKIQHESVGFGKDKRVIHWLGQKDLSGIRFITRNCFFEPSQEGKDWIDSCMNDIRIAFYWHKPAIISSHRVNYIGALNPKNRERSLQLLTSLLKSIARTWPEAEFMTSVQLGELFNSKRQNL